MPMPAPKTTDGRFLYYYGSLAMLQNSLRSKQIWLSDIRKSNDSEEISYGLRQIKHRLDAITKSLGRRRLLPYDYDESLLSDEDIRKYSPQLCRALQTIYNEMSEKRDSRYAHFDGRRCFALCFSGDGDLLSQWRGYGDDGRGVAIGFERPSILRYARKHRYDAVPNERTIFRPVYYRERDDALSSYDKDMLRQTPFLARNFEVMRGRMFRENEMGQIDRLLFELFGLFKQGTLQDATSEDELALIAHRCEELIAHLKQPTFYEEREERLFAWANPAKLSISSSDNPGEAPRPSLVTGVRGTSKLAMHLELQVISKDLPADEDHIGVGRIVLGPRCVADRQDIDALLQENGFKSTDVEILDSSLTYVG